MRHGQGVAPRGGVQPLRPSVPASRGLRALVSLPTHSRHVRVQNADCGWTTRRQAEGLVAHIRRIDALASRSTAVAPLGGPRSRGAILCDLETHSLGVSTAVKRLTWERCREVVNVMGVVRTRAPRGELQCSRRGK